MHVTATTLAKLSFPRVLNALAERAGTIYGAERALALLPYEHAADRERAHEAVSELLGAGISLGGMSDIRPLVAAVNEGKMLEGEQILQIAYTLDSAMSVKRSIVAGEEGALYAIASGIGMFDGVLRLVREQLDTDGSVRDSASPKLRDIRRRLNPLRNRIREHLHQIMARQSDAIQEPIITLRRDRYVIPVIAGMTGRVRGLILDRSGSGQTVFVEPHSIVDLNNELALLELEERDEVRRILIALAEAVATHPGITETLTAIGELDLHNAAARLAKDWQLVKPVVGSERLWLQDARHPLIANCVPNTIELGGSECMLIITGPNAGGKTVLLKTVGLAATMAASGLFVAASGTPELPQFGHIVSDIGDEQSIEASLSTYAGHLTNLREILRVAGPHSLVLIDELGSGTDPDEGAALSLAILEEVLRMQAFALVTSHLGPLKVFAAETAGVQNAAMVFDVDRLAPTYELLVGQPGRSYALAIAEEIGLPATILERAETLLGDSGHSLEQLLVTLEEQREELEQRLATARSAERQAVAEAQVLRAEIEKLRAKEADVVAQAAEKAEQLVADTLQQATRLRQRAASHDGRSEALTQMQQLRESVQKKRPEKPAKSRAESAAQLQVGATVEVPSYGASGTVLELRGNMVLVQLGLIKMEVPVADVVVKAAKRKPAPVATIAPASNAPRELHLRGKRVEEALEELHAFIADAVALKAESVRIVHGKGTGTLRAAVREFLKTERSVTSYAYAPPYEGGHGVTVATLRTQ